VRKCATSNILCHSSRDRGLSLWATLTTARPRSYAPFLMNLSPHSSETFTAASAANQRRPPPSVISYYLVGANYSPSWLLRGVGPNIFFSGDIGHSLLLFLIQIANSLQGMAVSRKCFLILFNGCGGAQQCVLPCEKGNPLSCMLRSSVLQRCIPSSIG
jgi:hypothetical protein